MCFHPSFYPSKAVLRSPLNGLNVQRVVTMSDAGPAEALGSCVVGDPVQGCGSMGGWETSGDGGGGGGTA